MNIQKIILSGACLLGTLSLFPAAQRLNPGKVSALQTRYQQLINKDVYKEKTEAGKQELMRKNAIANEEKLCEILEQLAQASNYLDPSKRLGGLETIAQWVEGHLAALRILLGRDPLCAHLGGVAPRQPMPMPAPEAPRPAPRPTPQSPRRPAPTRPTRPSAPSEELTPEEIEIISRERGVRPPVRRPTPPRPRQAEELTPEEVEFIGRDIPVQPRPRPEEERKRQQQSGVRPGVRPPTPPRPREPLRKAEQEEKELGEFFATPQPTPRPQPQPSPRKPEPVIPYCPAPGFRPEEERKKEQAPQPSIKVPQAVPERQLPPLPIVEPAPQVVEAPVRPARVEPIRGEQEFIKVEERPQQRHEFRPARPRKQLETIGAPQAGPRERIEVGQQAQQPQELQPVRPKPGPVTEIGPKEQARLRQLEEDAARAQREQREREIRGADIKQAKAGQAAQPVPEVRPVTPPPLTPQIIEEGGEKTLPQARPVTLPSPVTQTVIEEQEVPEVEDIGTPRMRRKLRVEIPETPRAAVPQAESKEEAEEEEEEGSVAGATPRRSLPSAFGTEPGKSAMRKPGAQPAGKKVSFAEALAQQEAEAEKERKLEAGLQRSRAQYRTLEQFQKERREQRAQAMQAFPKIKDATAALRELTWLAEQSDQIEQWAQNRHVNPEIVIEIWEENIPIAEGYEKRIAQLVGKVGGGMDTALRARKLVERIMLNVADYKDKHPKGAR